VEKYPRSKKGVDYIDVYGLKDNGKIPVARYQIRVGKWNFLKGGYTFRYSAFSVVAVIYLLLCLFADPVSAQDDGSNSSFWENMEANLADFGNAVSPQVLLLPIGGFTMDSEDVVPSLPLG